MSELKYVSPEYQAQLNRLAETLCTPERFSQMGQLALFAVENNVIELFPVTGPTPPEAA